MFLTSESQIMRWVRVFAISIVLFLGAGKEVFAIKASLPLNLSLTSRNLPDGQTELILQASASMAIEKVSMSIDLPASLALVSGDVKWDGAIAVGEKKEVKAFIRTLANIPAKVIGTALIDFPHGGSMMQQETLLLNTPKEKPVPKKPPILRKQGRDTILEFRSK